MTFLDAESEEIDHYDPAGIYQREGSSFELEANEELIGVYGSTSEHQSYITSFGFIAKVMP